MLEVSGLYSFYMIVMAPCFNFISFVFNFESGNKWNTTKEGVNERLDE